MGRIGVGYDVVTELRYDGDRVEFGARTDRQLFQNRLIKLGWRPVGPSKFSRRLTNGPGVERIFNNFTSHLREMLLQSARLQPVRWQVALTEFIDRTCSSGLRWWLYGSGALAVRGLAIEPGDLDLAVDDAQLAGTLLSDLLVEPVGQIEGGVADSGGRAFHGAIIEWLAGVHPTGLVPPHEQEPAVEPYLETVTWQGHTVPVPSLKVQLAGAERRGSAQRCELIRRAMVS